jgi:hypothetical protein
MIALAKNFKEGQLITWGTGFVRAKILELKDGKAKFELTVDALASDGTMFPAGYTNTMPLEHCRLLS